MRKEMNMDALDMVNGGLTVDCWIPQPAPEVEVEITRTPEPEEKHWYDGILNFFGF